MSTEPKIEARHPLEDFAKALETGGFDSVGSALNQRICCDGHECGCMGSSVGQYLAYELRALAKQEALIGQGWRTIDSAPNQTEVLVCSQGYLGWWMVAIQCALGEWWEAGKRVRPKYPPTHWQELPLPVKGEAPPTNLIDGGEAK